jgi:hypothetical protein
MGTKQRTLNLRAHQSSCWVPYGDLDDHYLRLGPGPGGSAERRLRNAPDSLAWLELCQPVGHLAHSGRKQGVAAS